MAIGITTLGGQAPAAVVQFGENPLNFFVSIIYCSHEKKLSSFPMALTRVCERPSTKSQLLPFVRRKVGHIVVVTQRAPFYPLCCFMSFYGAPPKAFVRKTLAVTINITNQV